MSEQDTLTVIYASDARGWVPLNVSVWTLVKNAAPTTTYQIYILQEGISDQQQEEMRKMAARVSDRHVISFIDVASYIEDKRLCRGGLPQMTWARIFSPTLLPHVHKAVYADIDTVVCADLKPLFEIPMEGKAVGVVFENISFPGSDFNERLGMPLSCQGYFNAGVLLMNLDFFRQENLQEKILAFSSAHLEGLRSLDQDALNATLYPYVVRIHPRWNWNDGYNRRIFKASPKADRWWAHPPKECIEAASHPGIVHFIGPHKPWRYNHRPWRKLWEDSARECGVVEKLVIPGWNLKDFIKRILYVPMYALTDYKIRRLAKRWGIK